MSKTGFKKGRLGIGTENPKYPLDVVGDIRLTGGFRDASGNDFNFLAINNQEILKTADIAGITCTDNKVGIFKTNPTEVLDISGNTKITGDLNFTGTLYQNGSVFSSGASVLNDLSDGLTDNNNNVGIGPGVLNAITSGHSNVSVGKDSLYSSNGSKNVAVGRDALYANTNGDGNVGLGYQALKGNTTGDDNIGLGKLALYDGVEGYQNIAIGTRAMNTNKKGIGNISIGHESGQKIGEYNAESNYNLVIGFQANISSNTATNEIVIGKFAVGHGSNIAVIGDDNVTAWHPGDDNGVDLGSASYSFKNIYFDGELYKNGSVFTGITQGQSDAITDNTAKTGITQGQSDAITDNTAKTGITPGQSSAITLNTDKVSSKWMTNTSKIYYNGGNVGIGTTSPSTLLVVGEDGGGHATNVPGIHMKSTTSNTKHYVVGQDTTHNVFLTYHANSTVANGYGAVSCYGGNNNLCLQHSGGNVGIGTTGAGYTLDVNGDVRAANSVGIGTTSSFTSHRLRIVGNPTTNSAQVYITGANHGIKVTSAASSGLYYSAFFEGSSGKGLYVRDDGNVGIGTTQPEYPLYVLGANHSFNYLAYMNSDGASSSNGYNSGDTGWGIYCNKSIATYTAFYIASDERIKENIVDVPDDLALEMVRNIPCRYYEYKDKAERGPGKTIGFIAQEVKEILPMAISIKTDIIPNEMRFLENISWEEIQDGSNNIYKLTTDLTDVSGVKYSFYVSNDINGNDEVKKEIIGNTDNTFTFDSSYNNVFCYGKEVDDFHTIAKDKIFTLNFSATQELDRQQQADKAEIAELKTEVATLKSELAAIKHHLGLA